MRDGKQNGNRRCKRQMARSAAEVLPGKRHGRANRLPNYDNGVSCCARPGVGCERHGEHSAPAVGVGATCTANTAPPRAGGYCLPAEIKERPVQGLVSQKATWMAFGAEERCKAGTALQDTVRVDQMPSQSPRYAYVCPFDGPTAERLSERSGPFPAKCLPAPILLA